MKKTVLLLALIVVVLLGIGISKAEPGDALYALKSWGGSVEYVADISDEITELENELAALDAQIESGVLSEAAAGAARQRITNRITAINAAVADAESTTLSPEARARLNSSLDRLSGALVTYRDSLVIVDAVADGEVLGEVKATLNVRPHTKRTSRLTSVIAQALETLEEHVEDALGDEYDGDLTDVIDSEGYVDDEGDPLPEEDDMSDDEMGSTTDDNTGTSTGEVSDEMEENMSEETMEGESSEEEVDATTQ